MLAEKLVKHGANCWLINTGWSGGKYGVGKRMSLKITRKILDEIHAGNLDNVPTRTLPVFGLNVPESVNGVPNEVIWPKDSWSNKEDYDNTLYRLGKAFADNFKKYEAGSAPEIKAAGPKLA
jgi:phosphoenolpyruvate carboxykinase (ATP)